MARAYFDESVDIAVQLSVDPRKPGQMIRGVAQVPHAFKKVRVAVFAQSQKMEEAKAAGADIVGGQELIDQVSWELARV